MHWLPTFLSEPGHGIQNPSCRFSPGPGEFEAEVTAIDNTIASLVITDGDRFRAVAYAAIGVDLTIPVNPDARPPLFIPTHVFTDKIMVMQRDGPPIEMTMA